MCYRNDLKTSTVFVRIPFGLLYIVPRGLSHSIQREKNAKVFSSVERLTFFFQMFVFSTTSKVLQKNSRITQEVSKDLLDSYKAFHDNCHLGYYAKNRPQLFFRGKMAFFSQLCFQKPLRCCRYVLIISTVNVRIPFEPLQIVLWGLSHPIIREQKAPNFFSRERLPFLFSEILVFNNLWGVTETIL